MSIDLLRDIEKAEARADDIRAEAQRQAREIIKSVEDACLVGERQAMLDHRAIAQRMLEDARVTATKRITALAEEDAAAREAMDAAAREKLDAAARRIFERIVQDGHR